MGVVNEGTGYLGTFLRGDYGDAYRPPEEQSPKCTLLVRRYRLTRGKGGELRLRIDTDAVVFEDEDAMAARIEDVGWFELPEDADGDPSYVPPEFDPDAWQASDV